MATFIFVPCIRLRLSKSNFHRQYSKQGDLVKQLLCPGWRLQNVSTSPLPAAEVALTPGILLITKPGPTTVLKTSNPLARQISADKLNAKLATDVTDHCVIDITNFNLVNGGPEKHSRRQALSILLIEDIVALRFLIGRTDLILF